MDEKQDHGVHATSHEYSRYDQVNKPEFLGSMLRPFPTFSSRGIVGAIQPDSQRIGID